LTPNELVLTFGGLHVCVQFGENRPWECLQTDRHTHARTDAKRFYHLSHAICYSYGADNNVMQRQGSPIPQWQLTARQWGLLSKFVDHLLHNVIIIRIHHDWVATHVMMKD